MRHPKSDTNLHFGVYYPLLEKIPGKSLSEIQKIVLTSTAHNLRNMLSI